MNIGSSSKLITSSSREDIEMWVHEFGLHPKYGSLTAIPDEVMSKLETFDGSSCIPHYRSFFAAGLLTCYTDLGQPRHLELYDENFFQQID